MVKYIFTLILVLISFTSCGSFKSNFQSTELRRIELSDSSLLKIVMDYKEEYSTKDFAIVILTNDIFNLDNKLFITDTPSLSLIYDYPISFYSNFNGTPVLIYSRIHKYVNPRKYDKEFVDYMITNLANDWYLKEIDEGMYGMVGYFNPRHSSIWKIDKGQLISEDVRLPFSKFLYHRSNKNFADLDDLFDIRVVNNK